MRYDPFSRCHPAVNFLYFVGAISFGVVIQHPAYLVAGCIGACAYYLLLSGRNGSKTVLAMVPLAVILSAVNPLFNVYGSTVLFYLFGRPYTLDALYYGMAIASIFIIMMLWFGCYNAVLTSDKFTSLFGNLIPALSLLLVMVLRLIPSFIRKAGQISGARKSIGKGAGAESAARKRIMEGMTILSSLTDWALEGSVVTADSMRARGYGCAGRTSFQIYRMTVRDWALLALTIALATVIIFSGGKGAVYTPALYIEPLSWGFPAYCVYLLIPTALHIKEAVTWHILRSGI